MNNKFYFAVLLFYTNIVSASFTIITTLYNEKENERVAEYLECLKNNSAHELIEKIYVLYDTSKDDEENTIRNYLKTNPLVEIIEISGRATYGQCFRLANELGHDRKIIICNADIYFNETLFRLTNYNLRGKFLALTRWNKKKDGSIVPFLKRNRKEANDSQDAWIFQTPIASFKYDNIMIGVMACDNCIAYQAKEAGLIVLNPCKTIQSIHVHMSEIRNYNQKQWPHPSLKNQPKAIVAWSYL